MARRFTLWSAVVLTLAFGSWSVSDCSAEAVDVDGHVASVTLYRGQAQVTRTLPIEGAAGGLEIVVGELPEQVVPDSLFAEGGDAVEVRAVRFRTRASASSRAKKCGSSITSCSRSSGKST